MIRLRAVRVLTGQLSKPYSCARTSFIAEERRSLGDARVRQEYECSFEAPEGLVYPDSSRAASISRGIWELVTEIAGEPRPFRRRLG
jgi:hypothetical protein